MFLRQVFNQNWIEQKTGTSPRKKDFFAFFPSTSCSESWLKSSPSSTRYNRHNFHLITFQAFALPGLRVCLFVCFLDRRMRRIQCPVHSVRFGKTSAWGGKTHPRLMTRRRLQIHRRVYDLVCCSQSPRPTPQMTNARRNQSRIGGATEKKTRTRGEQSIFRHRTQCPMW